VDGGLRGQGPVCEAAATLAHREPPGRSLPGVGRQGDTSASVQGRGRALVISRGRDGRRPGSGRIPRRRWRSSRCRC
jgi:hypothetical protein